MQSTRGLDRRGVYLYLGPLVCSMAVGACGGSPPPTGGRPDRPVVEMEELRITARPNPTGGFELDSYDAQSLFAEALTRQNEGECEDAVALYDRLAREFPASRFRSAGLYNAGFCLQDSGALEPAAERYLRLMEEGGSEDDLRHAGFQLVKIFIELERFADAAYVAERLLTRQDLSPDERMEAMARGAQARLGLDQLDAAAREARSALLYYRTRPEAEPVRDEFFAALANFVLAETLRARAAAIPVPVASTPVQHEALERRAQRMLDAQREYFNTIRLTNAHWAAAAGYRIGQMYDEFWNAITQAPPPPGEVPRSAQLREVWLDEYRLELKRWVKPLIRHAIRYWELTLLMVERTHVSSEWTDRIREDLERARTRLLEQPASLHETRSSGPRSAPPDSPAVVPAAERDVRGEPAHLERSSPLR